MVGEIHSFANILQWWIGGGLRGPFLEEPQLGVHAHPHFVNF